MEFNQDKTHIIVYRSDELKIINMDPFRLLHFINTLPKIKLARMFYKSNLIFFAGKDPINIENSFNNENLYPSNVLNIYDDVKKEVIESIKLNTEIEEVQVTKNFVSILSGIHIYVYKLEDLKKYVYKFDVTNKNYCLSNNSIIYVGQNKNQPENEIIKILTFGDNKTIEIKAHENKIKCMAINKEATHLATASERGTIIRIFNIQNGDKLFEFRRGTNSSIIQNIVFSNDLNFLAVLSDRGTIHIYNLKNITANRKSLLSVLGGYFDSDWSFAWYYDDISNQIKKCCFNKDNELLIMTDNCLCQKISFNKEIGGICNLVDKYQQ